MSDENVISSGDYRFEVDKHGGVVYIYYKDTCNRVGIPLNDLMTFATLQFECEIVELNKKEAKFTGGQKTFLKEGFGLFRFILGYLNMERREG